MTAHFVDKANPHLGYYEILTGPEGSRWRWIEILEDGTEYKDCGPWRATVSAAYRDAAYDWEENGNSSNRRLAGQLRAAATRSEKR
jgi:hypothetical protein